MDFSRKDLPDKDFDETRPVCSSIKLSRKHPLFFCGGDSSFVENLCEKWRTGKFCDVKLYPGIPGLRDNHAEPTPSAPSVLAHKLVIDYASPYFAHVFRVCDKEDKLESVLIPGMDLFTLQFLITYIYTGTVEGMTMTNMETILNGAETLRLESLKEASGNVLAELMNSEDVIQKWGFSIGHKCSESYYISVLQAYATDFIFDNHVQVFEAQGFLRLTEKQIERLLIMSTIRERAPASLILLAATTWVKFDPKVRQDLLPKLLEHVPLEEVPMPYLKTFFREDPLISANAKCQEYYLEFLEKLAMSNDRAYTAKIKPPTCNQPDDPYFRSGLASSLSSRSLIQCVKSNHRHQDFSSSTNPNFPPNVQKQEITKLKFKGEQEFRTFSAVINSHSDQYKLTREPLGKKDSETSTIMDFNSGIQTEVDCFKMSGERANSMIQVLHSCAETQSDRRMEINFTNLIGDDSRIAIVENKSTQPTTTSPIKNMATVTPKDLEKELPLGLASYSAKPVDNRIRPLTSVITSGNSMSSMNEEDNRSCQSRINNSIDSCGSESSVSVQRAGEVTPPVGRNCFRSQSDQPFSSRIARPSYFSHDDQMRSAKVSSYELKSPSNSKLCKTDVRDSSSVYGSMPWKPTFPRITNGMMDDFHKNCRARGPGVNKRGRPGKRKSKILLGRNALNSKLSLPSGHSPRSMMELENEYPRLGTPNRVMSRMTSNLRNNRLMFYVEDSVKEERYLMSYDFNNKARSKLAAYPFAGSENCFIFHNGSLFDFGGKFRDQADNRVGIFDFDFYQGKKPKWRSRPVPTMALPRYGFQCAVLNDFIYVIGGFHTLGAMNLCERLFVGGSLKFKDWKWEHVATMNRTRAQCSVLVFKGRIYAIGGFSADSEEKTLKIAATNSVEYYDPKSNEWCWCPGMQTERSGLCAVVLNNRMYAIGGGLCRFPEYSESKLKSVEVYDEDKFEWKYCASMKRARQNFSSVVFDGKIIAIGGDDDKDPTVESYDATENSWSIVEHLPPCGNYQTIGYKDSTPPFSESLQSF